MSYPPRILRVIYRSAHHPRRLARVHAKVPYSGIYALSEVLARALSQNEILWYRIEQVAPKEIAADPEEPEALAGGVASVIRTNVRKMGRMMEVYYNINDNRYIVVLNDEYIMLVSPKWDMRSQADKVSINILRGEHLGNAWVLL